MDTTHAQHEHHMHDRHEGHHTQDFLKKFWVVLALTFPLILYSDLPQAFFGWSAPAFAGSNWVALALGTFVFLYGGMVFLKGAGDELREKSPGMMTLISLAITAAYLYSTGSVLLGTGMTLFWELSTLIAVMLIGHWIEMKAVKGAQGALRELGKLLPDKAEVMREGKAVTVALSDLRAGDIALVRPGGKIPADGTVAEGESEVDEALITGESRPAAKSAGNAVVAGAINGDGMLKVRVEKTGEHTFLAGIMRLVQEAEASKSRLQLLSDRAAFYLTVLAVSAGAVTFAAWLYAHAGFGFAVERLVAVLVIACPHALGLAIPLVASISTTLAARNGFFVKRRLALESARNATVVLFDKTGTLTKGAFGVVSIIGVGKETLPLAAAANAGSEHPLARAIVREAQEKGVLVPAASGFARLPGKGVRAMVEGREVVVGSAALLQERDIRLKQDHAEQIARYEREGKTVVHVLSAGALVGSIALADVIRPESREAVEELKGMGIKVAMITGDAEDVAAWVAKDLGIAEYFSHVLPEGKADAVKKLQQRGERVVMVGDGVNDSPALAQADLGVAVGAGTNIAIESAGIILVRNDPRDIAKIIRLSGLTYSKMMQNLFWASAYNVIALPVAAGALAPYGIMLAPAFAAVLMSLSTVIVAVNASFLRSARL